MAVLKIALALMLLSISLSGTDALRKHRSHGAPAHKKNNQSLVTTNSTNSDKATIVDLPDVLVSIGQGYARLSKLRCFISAHFNVSDIDPDFSHMLLPINASLGTLVLAGEYSISYFMAPLYSDYGHVYLTLHNVSAKGKAAIALTPAALLAIDMNLEYNMSMATARIVPFIQNSVVSNGEMTLSRIILEDPVAETINREIIPHLNYLIRLQVNVALAEMSVFTVGQHKIGKTMDDAPDLSNQRVAVEELVDVLMENVRSRVPDEIDIPSFYKNFSEKLESTLINGTFQAESGWVSGLTTLKRASNISLSKEGGALELSISIGFDLLEMGYDHFVVKVLKKELSGELKGSFLYRVMTATLSLDPNELDVGCKVELKELKSFKTNGYRIETMADISKDFDWLKRRINIWLIGHFHSNVVKHLQREISKAIELFLNHFDCGEYVPHLRSINKF